MATEVGRKNGIRAETQLPLPGEEGKGATSKRNAFSGSWERYFPALKQKGSQSSHLKKTAGHKN